MHAHFTQEEQERLARSSVLLVGAGGLGSPVAYQLAAAGVGRIGLCDMDRVDVSNLQRQVLHTTFDAGRLKVESAADKLRALNPNVVVETHPVAITRENAMDLISGYDLVMAGADNFATRYLVNDACVMLGKPVVHGAVFRWDGQISVFDPKSGGPCYRCLYPSPPPPGAVPSCAVAGVIGVLPGVVGSMMAMEALKLLSGRGSTLTNRLLLCSTLTMDFTEVQVQRNPDCPVCGDHPTVTELIDYEAFCGGVGQ